MELIGNDEEEGGRKRRRRKRKLLNEVGRKGKERGERKWKFKKVNILSQVSYCSFFLSFLPFSQLIHFSLSSPSYSLTSAKQKMSRS